jgi:hypothetical protein
MRGIRWFVLAVVVAGSLGSAQAGRAKGGRGRGGNQPTEGFLEQLVRECKLTSAQQADLKAKVKARDEALAAWDTANAEKVQAAEAAAKQARTDKDADARKKAAGETKALKTAREAAGAEATAAILSALTDEQKAAWAGWQLYQSIAGRYRRAELTEEQLAKVKFACAFAAKEAGETDADADDKKAKRAKGAITAKLRWAIDVLVLTEEQRKTVSQASGRGRGKKGKDQQ